MIVVHTMGKVGSVAVYKTLKAAGYDALHVHYLTGQPLKDEEMARRIEKFKGTPRVITLIREPVRRNVSSFFNLKAANKLDSPYFGHYSHDIPLVFLDKEIKGYWGVDVYREPFNKAKGWQIYDNVLLIRQEDLRDAWNEAMFVFTGKRPPKLQEHNRTNVFGYSQFYNSILLDTDYVERMHDSKYYRHFYGKDE